MYIKNLTQIKRNLIEKQELYLLLCHTRARP